jgi:aminoglycoside phosphotransferase (APT) family kinase protein
MPSREQIVERYLARTRLAMADWAFYEAFGLFRLAVIVQQLWARYRAGHSTNPRFARYGTITGVLLQRAERVAACR